MTRSDGRPPSMKGYPKWINATSITLFVAAVFFSGALLGPTTLALKLDWEMPWRLQDTHRTWVAALHLLASFWFLMLFGALWSVHMRAGWKKRQGRKSGGALVALTIFLLLSALPIYYAGSEKVSNISALAHLATGLALGLLYLAHLLKRRRK